MEIKDEIESLFIWYIIFFYKLKEKDWLNYFNESWNWIRIYLKILNMKKKLFDISIFKKKQIEFRIKKLYKLLINKVLIADYQLFINN